MTYSSRKPYMTSGEGSADKHASRFLGKNKTSPESVFEKPYGEHEYQQMNQTPNIPTIDPPVGGLGGLKCLYSPNECEINAECYAGPDVRVSGGPEESEAGYLEPEVLEGALVKWEIGEDTRLIRLVLDPSVEQNLINVSFRDGWGTKHSELIEIVCLGGAPPTYSLLSDSVSVGADALYTGITPPISTEHHRLYLCCILFPDIAETQGVTISSATIEMFGYPSVDISEDIDAEIFAQLTGNASAPSGSGANFLNQMADRTVSGILWKDVATWTADTRYSTPDISESIQEVINLPTWSSGNDLLVFIEDKHSIPDPTTTAQRLNFINYDNTSYCARIRINGSYYNSGPFGGNNGVRYVGYYAKD